VLLDIMLPDGDGLEWLEERREEDWQTPVIVVSAHSERDRVTKAVRAGIAGYLTKPVSVPNTSDLVRRTLREAEAPRRPTAT
jgi:DNA-binding response OmpR family regulator